MSVDGGAAGVIPRLLFTAQCTMQGGSNTPVTLDKTTPSVPPALQSPLSVSVAPRQP